MTVSILLADDHQVVRQGLRALLEAESDFRVVGEAASGEEAITLAEHLGPQVLLLDLMMPGLSGLEVTRLLNRQLPQLRIVILSMHASDGYVVEAFRGGATGYVLKESQASVLIQAVREAAAGRRFLGPPLSEGSLESYVRNTETAPLDLYETLTRREREILHLAAESHTSGEIAHRLSISPRTVETHRANLMRKLGLGSQTELIRYALRRGILAMEP